MKGKRRKSREAVLKALYQWKLSGQDADLIISHFREDEEFSGLDPAFFSECLRGTISESGRLEASLQPFLDRPFS